MSRPDPTWLPAEALADVPFPYCVLHHCRCMDCRTWDHAYDCCYVKGWRKYRSREATHPAMQPFWNDGSMMRLDEWHYCNAYSGPVLGAVPWLWPKPIQLANLASCYDSPQPSKPVVVY